MILQDGKNATMLMTHGLAWPQRPWPYGPRSSKALTAIEWFHISSRLCDTGVRIVRLHKSA
jgi:hypothetical protein